MIFVPPPIIKPYDQTVLSDAAAGTHGDCVRASIRTYTQMDMEDLPHPVNALGWNQAFFDVLEENYGFVLNMRVVYPGRDLSFLPDVILAVGPTERTGQSKVTHMVVYDRIEGRVIHDPHPSRAGLLKVTQMNWLVYEPGTYRSVDAPLPHPPRGGAHLMELT